MLSQTAVQCRLAKPDKVVAGLGEAAAPCVFDIGAIELRDFETGTSNAATGRAGYTYVENAIDAALGGQVAAVTTAPLNKEALRAAGIPFPGHTEIFAAKTHAQCSCMLQYSSEVRCVFVTTHVGYGEVPKLLTRERILDTLELGAQADQDSRKDQPVASSAGAIGVMQLLPSTAADKNVGIPDISTVENNIHAGTKYMAFLREHYFSDPKIHPAAKIDFAWASYNAGPNRIRRLRNKAKERGFDPNRWFGNVEVLAAEKIGRETVDYVRNINKYFVAVTTHSICFTVIR